jgi:hypothetical protein
MLSMDVAFSEPSGNQILDAEETGIVTITVKNDGQGDAFDVKLTLKPSKRIGGLSFNESFDLGTLPSGKSIARKVSISAAESVATAKLNLSIELTEANGFYPDPTLLAFSTAAMVPPKLIVADSAIDDQSGNSKVEPMEMITMTVRVQNAGQGDARDVVADVTTGANVFIGGDGNAHFALGAMKSGEYRDIEFMFYTSRNIKAGQPIPIEVKVAEQRPQFNVSQSLALVMNTRQKNVREIVVQGQQREHVEITIAGGLSVDIEQNLPKTAMNNPNAFAVVIGNTDYRHAKPVEFAVRDAQTMKQYLIEVLGFREGNVFLLTNATKGDFEQMFGNEANHTGKLFNQIKAGRSEVFVFYSGHGAPSQSTKKGYFVPVEADPMYIDIGGYSLDTFYGNLSKLRAKSITVVLDSCFSGANIMENVSPIFIEMDNPVVQMDNAVVFTSSQGTQLSSWYNEKKHGMFTYFFLKAIHNKNADYDGNGEVTYDEVFRYVTDNSEGVPYHARSLHNVEQTPVIQGKYQGRPLVRYR